MRLLANGHLLIEGLPGLAKTRTTLDRLVELQHQAGGFSFLPRQPVHPILAGRHASRLRGRGLNFEEIRRYLPGDDVRQIDWKVTLRTRKTRTRVYTEERERSVLLVVDQRTTMFFGSVRNMKSVTAAEAGALAAWRTIAQQDRIGALVFNDARIEEIRPHRSKANAMRILGAVVEQNRVLTVASDIQPNPLMFPSFPTAPIEGLGIYRKDPEIFDQSERGELQGERRDTITYVCQRAGHFVVLP